MRIRSLLDPSVTPVLGEIEMSNLTAIFQRHAVPCLENVSKFSRRQADMFCRAVTGEGMEKRKLYTNDEQVLYAFRRQIIINGIETPTTRTDFLDRCVVINCTRMETFTTLQELDQRFEAARPRLLGSLLDLLVTTLGILEKTPSTSEFRMADFARFGRAVAMATGNPSNEFDNAYRLNIQQRNHDVLEDNPMIRVLRMFAAKHLDPNRWTGTTETLLNELKCLAQINSDVQATKDLPKSPGWLSTRLGELAPALAAEGIYLTKLPRTNAARPWEVYQGVPKANQEIIEQVRRQMEGGSNNE